MTLYKAVTSTDAMSSRTAKMSKPVSAFESRNSAKLRDIKNNAMELGARNKNWTYDNKSESLMLASFVSLLLI